ncbi:DapH/DapD/GlmU-related protein [Flavivirga aquimarina]|uniref:DapH/DapD/GlmU-related protein n=1 Tax=Flavivirga aquimarina TaxID=2027862 RepID=A0ABT8WD89_9FLAO|nr:N-acetyltransferase [Flavivirga aquimarina]MDO5971119.1 DapH/DapD/GlmU-related protein [Flavivirga aquimarina]
MSVFIHNLSDVHTNKIGAGTRVWQFVVILKGATIGKNCNICAQVLIENDVIIGDSVTVKSGVQIWDGITIKDNVFIGPNVTFTNDLVPRSKINSNSFTKIETIIEKGATIGANATIIAGNKIGQYAFVGAGSVVTKPIKNNELWVGNPAKHIGYITNEGRILGLDLTDKDNKKYEWYDNTLIEKND